MPEIEPRTIAAGGSGSVIVKAAPLSTGEKTVSLTLKTDSPASPEVVLRLRIIGSRRPPYMTQAGGDLGYISEFSGPEVREIFVFTLESADAEPNPPVATSDLPNLRISAPTLLQESPSFDPGAMSRKYEYKAIYSGTPSESRFSGEVVVVDPWDPDHIERLRVHGEVVPRMKAVPARVVLWANEVPGAGDAEITVLVLTRSAAPDLFAEVVGGGSPLTIGPMIASEDGREASFRVALQPGAVQEGEYTIRVGRGSSPERITVPVAVHRKGKP